jgi:hypothetical protein
MEETASICSPCRMWSSLLTDISQRVCLARIIRNCSRRVPLSTRFQLERSWAPANSLRAHRSSSGRCRCPSRRKRPGAPRFTWSAPRASARIRWRDLHVSQPKMSSHSPSTPSCPLPLSACACAFAASAVARPNDRTARTRTSLTTERFREDDWISQNDLSMGRFGLALAAGSLWVRLL